MINVPPICRTVSVRAFALLTAAIAHPAGADDEISALVERRVREWQPTKNERLLDQVGWASDLVEARALSKLHNRPLFVFTYSGSTTRANAIALQRC